jgi:hypothetical protein
MVGNVAEIMVDRVAWIMMDKTLKMMVLKTIRMMVDKDTASHTSAHPLLKLRPGPGLGKITPG